MSLAIPLSTIIIQTPAAEKGTLTGQERIFIDDDGVPKQATAQAVADLVTVPTVPGYASQAEAEGGTESTKIMTALRVEQAGAAQLADHLEGLTVEEAEALTGAESVFVMVGGALRKTTAQAVADLVTVPTVPGYASQAEAEGGVENTKMMTALRTAQAIAALGGGNDPGYLEYVALLTQSGTNAPVATVLENTLGGVPVWKRADVGVYRLTLAGAFTVEKTWVSMPNAYIDDGDSHNMVLVSTNLNWIQINVLDGANEPIELGKYAMPIEIRVYQT